jgi:hypothetical protein
MSSNENTIVGVWKNVGGTPIGSPVIPKEYNPFPSVAQGIWTGADAKYGISESIAEHTGLNTPFKSISGKMSNAIDDYASTSATKAGEKAAAKVTTVTKGIYTSNGWTQVQNNSAILVRDRLAQNATSAVNDAWSSGTKGIIGKAGTGFVRSVGGNIISFGVGSTIDISTGTPPDEAFGTNAVTSIVTTGGIATFAAVQGIPVVDVGVDVVVGISLVVGVANYFLRKIPAVSNWEDGIGHDITNLLGGEPAKAPTDSLNKKTGRLTIKEGGKYKTSFGHSGAIKLEKDQVDDLAKTISKSTDSFCADMKKLNNNIPKALEEMKEEVETYLINNILFNYPHLTAADIKNEMAKYPVSAMYSEDDVNTSNSNIDKLGENLAKVSSSIKQVAKGMKELDQNQAMEIYQSHMYGGGTPTYGIQANRNWN